MTTYSRVGLALLLTAFACDDTGEKVEDQAEAKSEVESEAEPETKAAPSKDELATAPKAEPAPVPDTKPAVPQPEPEAPEPDPFEAHVTKLLAHTGVEPGPDPGKEAWAHYKAKRHTKAIPLFGAAALAKPTQYKPAFNMACAAALAGDEESSRIALTEALTRDRATVTAKANKDGDLASIRSKPWFAELLKEPTARTPREEPKAPDTPGEPVGEPVEEPKESWYDQNCADLDPSKKIQRCWDEFLVGDYDMKALVFDTAIPLPELPDPGSMPKSRMRRVKAKFDIKAIGQALGIRGAFGLNPDKCEGPYRLPEVYDDDCPFYRPFYWWPTDEEVVLIIPHTVRRSPVTARTVTVAKQVDGVWKGHLIDSLIDHGPNTHLVGGSWQLSSGPILRGDGRELWVFAEGDTGDDADLSPYLCRIRWNAGALESGCRLNWEHQFSDVYP